MAKNGQWQLSVEAAERYERYVARYILGPWASLLVDASQVGVGERVLDVACGTGVVARAAAERAGAAGRIVGADLNSGMIAVARSLPVPAGAPIAWIECSALGLPLQNATMDVVLCQQGLQFFPDKALAMREMRRVLARGGRLALSVWNGIGFTTARSAKRSLAFSAMQLPYSFAPRDGRPPKRSCRVLQQKLAFQL